MNNWIPRWDLGNEVVIGRAYFPSILPETLDFEGCLQGPRIIGDILHLRMSENK